MRNRLFIDFMNSDLQDFENFLKNEFIRILKYGNQDTILGVTVFDSHFTEKEMSLSRKIEECICNQHFRVFKNSNRAFSKINAFSFLFYLRRFWIQNGDLQENNVEKFYINLLYSSSYVYQNSIETIRKIKQIDQKYYYIIDKIKK